MEVTRMEAAEPSAPVNRCKLLIAPKQKSWAAWSVLQLLICKSCPKLSFSCNHTSQAMSHGYSANGQRHWQQFHAQMVTGCGILQTKRWCRASSLDSFVFLTFYLIYYISHSLFWQKRFPPHSLHSKWKVSWD